MATTNQNGLNANKYTTKKTVSQGILDVALLTTNVSQLMYILKVGETHEFYTLMLVLISISIILQVCKAGFSIFLGSALNINDVSDSTDAENTENTGTDHSEQADIINNIILVISMLGTAVNVFISVFDMRDTDNITTK